MTLRTLTYEEVLSIHNALADDFIATKDPISPPGVRSQGLLESAVHRQHIGTGEGLKFADEFTSAATLAYGLCMNHCFHNGNKRTSLVSMLCHLDKNGLRLNDVSETFLYDLFINFADHKIHRIDDVRKWSVVEHSKDYVHQKTLNIPKDFSKLLRSSDTLTNPDLEVFCLAAWLRRNTRAVKNFDKEITLRELRRILGKFNVRLERGSDISHNVLVQQTYQKREGWLFGKTVTTVDWYRVYSFNCGGDNRGIPINKIKELRRAAKLSPEDGIDALTFYGDEPAIDFFLANYSRLLKRLART